MPTMRIIGGGGSAVRTYKRCAHHDFRAEDPEDVVAEQSGQKNCGGRETRDADQADAL